MSRSAGPKRPLTAARADSSLSTSGGLASLCGSSASSRRVGGNVRAHCAHKQRTELEDDASASWFNVFNIIFELVSGYGTVGLSLGLPYDNYS